MSRAKRKPDRLTFPVKRTARERMIAELVEHCDVIHLYHLRLMLEAAESWAGRPGGNQEPTIRLIREIDDGE